MNPSTRFSSANEALITSSSPLVQQARRENEEITKEKTLDEKVDQLYEDAGGCGLF